MASLRYHILILLLALSCALIVSQQNAEEEPVGDGFIEGSASYSNNNPDDEDSYNIEASAIPPADLKPAIPPENVIETKYTSPSDKSVVPTSDDSSTTTTYDDQNTGISITGVSSTSSPIPSTDEGLLSTINIIIVATIIIVIIIFLIICCACRGSRKDGYTRGNKMGETI
uniref:Syndecan domain-containing protein n=1 Tax=Parastrongyloides trichosuri TaxID=131310 RepID=A0A0N4Z7X7_PARTI